MRLLKMYVAGFAILTLLPACQFAGTANIAAMSGGGGTSDRAITAITESQYFFGNGFIDIDGRGLSSNMSVTVGGQPCTQMTVVSPQKIRCLAPVYKRTDIGSYPVVITEPGKSPLTAKTPLAVRDFTGLQTVAGKTQIVGYQDGTGGQARLGWIGTMAMSADVIYFTDKQTETLESGNLAYPDWSLLRKLDLSTGAVTTIAGKEFLGAVPTIQSDDEALSDVEIGTVGGIAAVGTDVYYIDNDLCIIRKIDTVSGRATIFAGPTAATIRSGLAADKRSYASCAAGIIDGDAHVARFSVTEYDSLRDMNAANGALWVAQGTRPTDCPLDSDDVSDHFNYENFDGACSTSVIRRIDLKSGAVTTPVGSKSRWLEQRTFDSPIAAKAVRKWNTYTLKNPISRSGKSVDSGAIQLDISPLPAGKAIGMKIHFAKLDIDGGKLSFLRSGLTVETAPFQQTTIQDADGNLIGYWSDTIYPSAKTPAVTSLQYTAATDTTGFVIDKYQWGEVTDNAKFANDGIAGDAGLARIDTMSFDGDKKIYFADYAGSFPQIRCLDVTTLEVKTLGGLKNEGTTDISSPDKFSIGRVKGLVATPSFLMIMDSGGYSETDAAAIRLWDLSANQITNLLQVPNEAVEIDGDFVTARFDPVMDFSGWGMAYSPKYGVLFSASDSIRRIK